MLTSACGGDGGGKSAAAAPAAHSSEAPATGGTTLTEARLQAALLGATEITGYTSDPSDDASGVTTTQTKVTVGGTQCQRFMDASDALVSVYGTTAQVDRQYSNAAGMVLHVTLTAYPSAAKAQAEVADLDAGVAGCRSAATVADSSDDRTTMTLTAGPSVGSVAGGEDVSAYTLQAKQSGFDITLVVETVRVGASVVSVGLGGEGNLTSAEKDMRDVAVREVAKLQAAQL